MLIEKAKTEYLLCRIPGLVVTERGSLIGYYECRRSDSDWADIDIKVIRSTDDGENFETVCVIPSNGNTLNNPMMIVKGEDIHFLYHKNYKQLLYSKSCDDGLTFSEPIDISEVFEDGGFFYNVAAIGPGHGIVHDGTIIMPVWFAYNEKDKYEHHPSFISTLYSEDDGKSWKLGEIIGKDVLTDPSECALAVTADNRVLISIRNENACRQRAFAISDNGFSNWEDLHFNPDMPDPICQGSMCSAEGKIFHINCAHDSERVNLTIKTSDNNFESFDCISVDEIGGYSDIAEKDGTLYILYERDPWNDGLYFKKVIKYKFK